MRARLRTLASDARLRRLVPAAVLVVALGGGLALVATSPSTERQPESFEPPVVGVVPVDRAAYPRAVEAYGSLVPSREATLYPEVQGPVVEIHPHLEPGGIVRAGEVLLRVDPAEYELAVAGAQAALAEAQAALEIERGRQVVAQREWELFGAELPDAELGRELALRVPQLRQAEARIASARSALDRARLDLERTALRVPFDALVVRETTEVGQRVTPQSAVAELAGVEVFWARASLSLDRLPAVIAAAERGGAARVVLTSGLDQRVERSGRLVRQLGSVEAEGRMAQVLVAVDDPLGLSGGPALPLGSYVRVELDAGVLEDAVRVPRQGLRENGEVWVADAEDRLRVRRVQVLWRQGDEVAVGDVFQEADRLIVSPVGSPVPGMAVRPRPVEPDTSTAEGGSEVDDGRG